MLLVTVADGARGQPAHGLAMHGEPALAPGFEALPYVNPEAPQGGQVVFGELGGFDSLNPFVLRGRAPWPLASHMVESLMARSYGEPFTLYGLLAESVEVPPDRAWVAFTLREEARFSDGSPVTVEDVIWSLEALGTEGHPRYRALWSAIAGIEQTGPRALRIDFTEANRELPLLVGLRPVLKKASFEGRALDDAPLTPLIGSGPYLIENVEPGRFITFRRNPDWWGADLPVNRGLNNFERVRYEYFRNADALWEAVTSGAVQMFSDGDPVRWAEGYDFPAIADGRLTRTELAHSRPTGMTGFVFNTRRSPLDDLRVREALSLAFDWAWINDRLYRGQYARIESYLGNSPLAHRGPAEGRERAILAPFAETLPAGALEGTQAPPGSDGSGRDRRNLRRAAKLLAEAGWEVVDGERRDAAGTPLQLELLVTASSHATLGGLWAEALRPLGVGLTVRRVDAAQFIQRRQDYDFDLTVNRWPMSLSPGTEQRLYFGSEGRAAAGTRNYAGVAEPAVDGAIDALLAAEGQADFEAAVRALDRALMAGRYVVPFGALPTDRIVHDAALRHPNTTSLYGWFGWWAGPGIWWRAP
ncbi:MAG: extracellular solute-binding protein [Pseudomonadota bacterium]